MLLYNEYVIEFQNFLFRTNRKTLLHQHNLTCDKLHRNGTFSKSPDFFYFVKVSTECLLPPRISDYIKIVSLDNLANYT